LECILLVMYVLWMWLMYGRWNVLKYHSFVLRCWSCRWGSGWIVRGPCAGRYTGWHIRCCCCCCWILHWNMAIVVICTCGWVSLYRHVATAWLHGERYFWGINVTYLPNKCHLSAHEMSLSCPRNVTYLPKKCHLAAQEIPHLLWNLRCSQQPASEPCTESKCI
jgi:hypothetical protein